MSVTLDWMCELSLQSMQCRRTQGAGVSRGQEHEVHSVNRDEGNGQSNSRSQRSSTSRVECAEAYIREYVARHVAGSPCWRVGRNYKRKEKTFPCLNQTGEGFSLRLYCGKVVKF